MPPPRLAVSPDQLLGLVQDNAESNAKTANELETLNERMEKVEGHLVAQTGLLQQLVVIQSERNEREKLALEIEAKAREVSGDAKLKLVEGITEDRRVWSAWAREQATKVTTPVGVAIGTGIALVVTGATVGLAGWIAGFFGGHP